jgi:hypothetical protein
MIMSKVQQAAAILAVPSSLHVRRGAFDEIDERLMRCDENKKKTQKKKDISNLGLPPSV